MSKIKPLIILPLLFYFCFASAENLNEPSGSDIRGKTILASLAIPGLGQGMLNNKLKSEIMLWTDGAIWLLYSGLSWYGYSRNHDAKLFAGINAHANTAIKSDKYYRALERYDNTCVYNEDIRREARERYPDDPSAQNSYISQYCFYGDSTWDWGSDSLRFYYWDKRKIARTAFTRASFVLGGAILNRLVSAIDCALFTADKRNTIGFAPNSDNTGIGLIFRF